jgi:hypothetical protein
MKMFTALRGIRSICYLTFQADIGSEVLLWMVQAPSLA